MVFQKNNSSYNLRNSDFIIPRYSIVKYGKHSLRYDGLFLYSKLTNGIKRNAISLSAFKNKIRKTNLETLVGDDNFKDFPLCSG